MATNSILNKYVGPWLAQPSPSSIEAFTSGVVAPISPFGVFGVAAPKGLYIVILQLIIDTAGTGGTLRLQISATGSNGATVFSLPAKDVTIQGMESGIFAIDTTGAADMQVSVVSANATGSYSYSYRVICDKKSNQG